MGKLEQFYKQRAELNTFLLEREKERLERKEKIEHLTDIYKQNEAEETITYEALKMLEISERVGSESVEFEKVSEDDCRMVFLTFMMDGGSFGLHKHDCVEIVKVLKGSLIEKTRGYKVYNTGETVIYSAFEEHKPYATENSTYEVTFLKELK